MKRKLPQTPLAGPDAPTPSSVSPPEPTVGALIKRSKGTGIVIPSKMFEVITANFDSRLTMEYPANTSNSVNNISSLQASTCGRIDNAAWHANCCWRRFRPC